MVLSRQPGYISYTYLLIYLCQDEDRLMRNAPLLGAIVNGLWCRRIDIFTAKNT
jgi:hypothetical protein